MLQPSNHIMFKEKCQALTPITVRIPKRRLKNWVLSYTVWRGLIVSQLVFKDAVVVVNLEQNSEQYLKTSVVDYEHIKFDQ